ncbi:MAG: F0F1 ATP synthase subunit epsilon, partial [Candidatus Eremiobacteraeota bacterium]|nr:F0F1 ATP synthase subunit epsilon [Candidatus Eremiobacteraeota bacterium]
VDEGVLFKEGPEVRVVSLRVVEGQLEELAAAVRAMLDQTEQHERKTRAALASLEAGLVRHFAYLELAHGR